MSGDTNYYARLGIPQGATKIEIKRAYRQIARRLHPDVNIEHGATELFLRVKEAYEILSDVQKRSQYDADLPRETQRSPQVNLSIQFSHSALTFVNEKQLIYTLFNIEIPSETSQIPYNPPPLNVVLILDKSTSMQGPRLDIIKATAIELLRQLRTDDIVSIIAFNDKAEVILPADSREKPLIIENRIRRLRASGGTELYQGLKKGLFEIQRNVSTHYTNHVILITDGKTYGDDEACLRLANNASVLGVGITAMGIGSNWNDELLDAIASKTGGSTEYISNALNIRELLENKFMSLRQTKIKRVIINFDSKPGVSVNFAFRLSPELGILKSSSPIRLGSIPGKQKLQFILELMVDPIPDNQHELSLIEGDLTFEVPSDQIPTNKIPIHLKRIVADLPDLNPPPKEIIKAMSRLTLYRMQDQARHELAHGEIEKATQRLHHLSTRLLSHGNLDLAKIALEESRYIQKKQELSLNGVKEIKYGTRGLLLPSRLQSPGES